MKITKRSENEIRQLPVSQFDPVTSLRSMHELMDRLFSEHFIAPFGRLSLSENMPAFSPKVDISETENNIKVRAEVPGIQPDDVSIEVTEDTLSISGSLEKSVEEKEENYYRIERSSGRFSREFMLPAKVDADNVDAQASNGVITITLTKLPSEQKRKVKIKT